MLLCQLQIYKLTLKKDLTGLQTARLSNNFESDQIQCFVGSDLLVQIICSFSSHRYAGNELSNTKLSDWIISCKPNIIT